MAWTAKLTKIEKDETSRNIIATVVFTDGQISIPTSDIRGDNLTIDTIAKISAVRIRSLEDRDAAFAVLQTKIGDVPLTPIIEPDALQVALQELAAIKFKIDLGVKTVDDLDYVTALDKAKQLQAIADQA